MLETRSSVLFLKSSVSIHLPHNSEAENSSPFPARSRKKRKRLQRALDTDNSHNEPEDIIEYPTGEVPGRGDCQLVDRIGIDKATYNTFAVRLTYFYLMQQHMH